MNRRAAAVPLLSLRSAEREGSPGAFRSGLEHPREASSCPRLGYLWGGNSLAERSPPRGHRAAPERMTAY